MVILLPGEIEDGKIAYPDASKSYDICGFQQHCKM
jgi:hypothetical protein